MKPIIAYKVVHKKYRYGSNASAFIQSSNIRTFLKFLKDHRKASRFFPLYIKDSTIKAPYNTPGIFCFMSKKYAIDYMCDYGLHSCKIIKVEGYNRRKDPQIFEGGFDLDKFFHYYYIFNSCKIHVDRSKVITFGKIKVLE